MKNLIGMFINSGIIILSIAVIIHIKADHISPKPKVLECPIHIEVIDLPEEISEIKETTKIKGFIRNDTLFIRFHHIDILHYY